MSSSSSDSSSSNNQNNHSSGSDNGSNGGWSSIGDVSSSDVGSLVIALEVFQGNVGIGFSKNSHGLCYTSLRMESLELEG